MASVATMILAGGRSSRMGHDKALLAIGTEPLIHRTCRVALASTDAVYVVSSWCDRYRALVPDGVKFIEEQPWSDASAGPEGPLIALTQAFQGLPAALRQALDWVLVLACDMPSLSADTIQTWRHGLDRVEATQLAYLPQRQGRWEPLCGFYRVAALDALQQYGAAGGRSLQRWLNQHPIAIIPLADEGLLVNVNTPADWAQWATSPEPSDARDQTLPP